MKKGLALALSLLPAAGWGQTICPAPASVEELLRRLAGSTGPSAELVKQRILADALRYLEFRALAARDPSICRLGEVFRSGGEIDSVDGAAECRRVYLETALPFAAADSRAEVEPLCRTVFHESLPAIPQDTARQLCSFAARDQRLPAICAEMKRLLGTKSEDCRRQVGQLLGEAGACDGLPSKSRIRDRCLAIAAYRRARAAGDPRLCGDSELCGLHLGKADEIFARYTARVRDLACRPPETPRRRPRAMAGLAPERAPHTAAEAMNAITGFHDSLRDERPPEPAKAALGALLFFDPRLSADGRMSCSTCHQPDKAWSDGLPRARGLRGEELPRRTPSLLNSRLYRTFSWDGRVQTLEEQVLRPIENPKELGQSMPDLLRKLERVPEYKRRFQDVFGGAPSSPAVASALAAFVVSLGFQEKSPFERFQEDPSALSARQKRGLVLFAGKAGCIRCHLGSEFSYGQFVNIGVPATPGPDDLGRYDVVRLESMKGAFRVPSLRNVALRPPYMHNGSLKSLREVIEFYDRGAGSAPSGLGRLGLDAREKDDLEAFLNSLTNPQRAFAPPSPPPDGG